jgi:hypothetical protein
MARAAAAFVATALVLLAVACGGSPSSTGSGGSVVAGASSGSPSTGAQKALAFSVCVRARGVPRYPDPGSNGQIVKEPAQQLGVSTSRLQAAVQACQHLLPDAGGSANSPADSAKALAFSRCMRARGVPDYPDPGSNGQIVKEPAQQLGVSTSRLLAALNACQHLLPGTGGGR